MPHGQACCPADAGVGGWRLTAIVKGCPMPALSRGREPGSTELAGQASDKPQGRKPRDAPVRSEEPTQLWGFDCWQAGRRRRSGEPTGRRHRSHARRCGCEGGLFDTHRRTNHVTPTQGKAVHHWRWPLKSGRTRLGNRCPDHAAARWTGGARMGCLRAKVSMMVMGAPQCGHTKVGWTMATGASGG